MGVDGLVEPFEMYKKLMESTMNTFQCNTCYLLEKQAAGNSSIYVIILKYQTKI